MVRITKKNGKIVIIDKELKKHLMILNIKTGLFLMNCQRNNGSIQEEMKNIFVKNKLGDIEIMDIQNIRRKII